MRMRILLPTIALLAPAIGSAQGQPPRPDTTRRDTTRRDTAQRLPAATVRDSTPALPSTYLRRSAFKGRGKFLLAKDIEKIDPPHTPLLLARVSGGDIRDIGSGESVIVGNRGTRMSFSGNVPNELCVIGLAINDTRVPAGYDMKAIKPGDIAAIEFYNGPASIPLELRGAGMQDADCGLFVIWLKERRRPR